jgi:hypothetical protein
VPLVPEPSNARPSAEHIVGALHLPD